MVLCVRAGIRDAEHARLDLSQRDAMDRRYRVTADGNYVYFPVLQRQKGYEHIDKKLTILEAKPSNLKDSLKARVSCEDLGSIITSFDTVGKIIIIDIREGMGRYEKAIAEALLAAHPRVETVCKRAGKHEGEFRVRPVKVIGGEKNTLTEYKESGARMLVDVNRVYFTPRLSHERERIAAQVKPGEKIAYFFAGVGPFAFVIARKQPKVKIYAIELNPDAYELMARNVQLNRLDGIVIPILGDVAQTAGDLEKCDRVIMPLPKDASDFLKDAFAVSRKGTVIHYYQFTDKGNPFEAAIATAEKKAKENGMRIKIKNKRIVRPFNPRTVQVALDIAVLGG